MSHLKDPDAFYLVAYWVVSKSLISPHLGSYMYTNMYYVCGWQKIESLMPVIAIKSKGWVTKAMHAA